MTVASVMTEAVVADTAEDTVAEASAKMYQQQTGSLLVVDGDRLVGIFTERDLLKVVARGEDPKLVQLKDVMRTELVTVTPDTRLRACARIMADNWIRHLPVVDGDRVVGMISQRDLIGVFAQALDEPERMELLSQGELVRARRIMRIEAGDLD
jgi:CBS domain-containing protein